MNQAYKEILRQMREDAVAFVKFIGLILAIAAVVGFAGCCYFLDHARFVV